MSRKEREREREKRRAEVSRATPPEHAKRDKCSFGRPLPPSYLCTRPPLFFLPSAVDLPPVSAAVADAVADALAPCIASGALSKLQVEGVLHACAKHETLLPRGRRAGFLLGDGAGVGKGRQVAAAALVNLVRVQRARAATVASSRGHTSPSKVACV